MNKKSKLQMIPTDKLYPHPDNPRIDRVYLNPFVDMPNETMALALRKDFKGTPYFAVKFGMIAYGFICAYEIVDEDFVRQLKSLYIESDMILKNKKG